MGRTKRGTPSLADPQELLAFQRKMLPRLTWWLYPVGPDGPLEDGRTKQIVLGVYLWVLGQCREHGVAAVVAPDGEDIPALLPPFLWGAIDIALLELAKEFILGDMTHHEWFAHLLIRKLAAFVKKTYGRSLRECGIELADAVTEVYLKTIHEIHGVRCGVKPVVWGGPKDFGSWLLQVAHHAIVDLLRKAQSPVAEGEGEEGSGDTEAEGGAGDLDAPIELPRSLGPEHAQALLELLRDALSRKCLLLVIYDIGLDAPEREKPEVIAEKLCIRVEDASGHLDTDQIAALFGKSRGSVRQLRCRAKATLDDIQQSIASNWRSLPPELRQFAEDFFGLHGKPCHTCQEIADKRGMTLEETNRLLQSLIQQLKGWIPEAKAASGRDVNGTGSDPRKE